MLPAPLLPPLPSFWPGLQPQVLPETGRTRTRPSRRQPDRSPEEPYGSEPDALRGGSPTPEMLVEHADALLSLGLSWAGPQVICRACVSELTL